MRPMLHGPKCEMSKSREKRAAAIQDGIRQILYRDWDPIGVWGTAPQDEYDSYIGGVYRRLATSRSEEALVQFLAGAFEDLLGSQVSAPERLARGGSGAPRTRCSAVKPPNKRLERARFARAGGRRYVQRRPLSAEPLG